MIKARHATVDDAGELVRLRKIMLEYFGPAPDGDWQQFTRRTVRRRLADPDGQFAATVIDAPDETGLLASCAIGLIDDRLGSPHNPTGRIGYVFSVATDPAYRRRGYSRACMTALIDWFREQSVAAVDLKASAEGEPLYASLGFVRTPDPLMRLRLD